jgi:hypothetical protein
MWIKGVDVEIYFGLFGFYVIYFSDGIVRNRLLVI